MSGFVSKENFVFAEYVKWLELWICSIFYGKHSVHSACKHKRTGRHFTGGRKKFALKITIFPKNKQFALKITF